MANLVTSCEDVFRMVKCLMNLESEFNSSMNLLSTTKTDGTPAGNLAVRTHTFEQFLEMFSVHFEFAFNRQDPHDRKTVNLCASFCAFEDHSRS